MEFGIIKEIGTSFLIGSVALLIFEGFLYFSTGWTMTGFFRLPLGLDPPKDPPATTDPSGSKAEIRAGAFVALAIIVGMTVHAVMARRVTESPGPISAFSVPILKLVTDEHQRDFWGISVRSGPVDVLYKDFARKELSSLGKELADFGIPSLYCKGPVWGGADDLGLLLPLRGNSEKAADQDCALRLYYTAKNWSFRQTTLFEELVGIETRVQFFGALGIICALMLPLTFLFWAVGIFGLLGSISRWLALAAGWCMSALMFSFVCFPPELLRNSDQIHASKTALAASITAAICLGLTAGIVKLLPTSGSSASPAMARRMSGRFALFALAIVVSHVVSYWAYTLEQGEFARRIYGYFSTAHLELPTKQGS
jgi:hypothetical protein